MKRSTSMMHSRRSGSSVKSVHYGIYSSAEIKPTEKDESIEESFKLEEPKIGDDGAKDDLKETYLNILQTEAMCSAREIIDSIMRTAVRPKAFHPDTTEVHAHLQPEPFNNVPLRPILVQDRWNFAEENKTYLNETMNDIILKISVVEGNIELLGNICSHLLEDNASKESDVQDLIGQLKILRDEKADEKMILDLLETKASSSEVLEKVSHAEFLEAMQELSEGLMNAINLICRQKTTFKDAVDFVLCEVGKKLNRCELQPLRDIVDKNLKKLYVRLKNIENMKKITQSAVTSKHLTTQQVCLACAADALMKECKSVPIPVAPRFIPHTNIKPFLTYQLDRMRKNPLRKRTCTRYCGGSHTLMHRHGRPGRRVYADYPCGLSMTDTELKPRKRPTIQRSSKKTKEPSIDSEFLKTWASTGKPLDAKQQSYVNVSRIRDQYRKVNLATKELVLDLDDATSDSRNKSTYDDIIWRLSKIDPSNPVIIDYLPIKVGKSGVYYPANASITLDSHLPTKVAEKSSASSACDERPSELSEYQNMLKARSSKTLIQNLTKRSSSEFKLRDDDVKGRTQGLIWRISTTGKPSREHSTTSNDTQPSGSKDDVRRESATQYGRKTSRSSHVSYELFRDDASVLNLQTDLSGDYNRENRNSSVRWDTIFYTEKIDRASHSEMRDKLKRKDLRGKNMMY